MVPCLIGLNVLEEVEYRLYENEYDSMYYEFFIRKNKANKNKTGDENNDVV